MEWYQRNPKLFELEQRCMRKSFPSAVLITLADGRLAWLLTFQVPTEGNKTRPYQICLAYDHDHPARANKQYGGSIKCYPIQPTIQDMFFRAGMAGHDKVPHIVREASNALYLCTSRPKDNGDGKKKILTAVAAALNSYHFLCVYEQGLLNEKIWQEFCKEYIA